jgi:hypothetical protein
MACSGNRLQVSSPPHLLLQVLLLKSPWFAGECVNATSTVIARASCTGESTQQGPGGHEEGPQCLARQLAGGLVLPGYQAPCLVGAGPLRKGQVVACGSPAPSHQMQHALNLQNASPRSVLHLCWMLCITEQLSRLKRAHQQGQGRSNEVHVGGEEPGGDLWSVSLASALLCWIYCDQVMRGTRLLHLSNVVIVNSTRNSMCQLHLPQGDTLAGW